MLRGTCSACRRGRRCDWPQARKRWKRDKERQRESFHCFFSIFIFFFFLESEFFCRLSTPLLFSFFEQIDR